MFVVVVGLNHRTSPVAMREHLCVSKSDLPEVLQALRSHSEIQATVVLSTCNRLEIYAAVDDVGAGSRVLKEFLIRRWQDGNKLNSRETLEQHTYVYSCQEAIIHLFRVAAGLDSQIIGETQILGQVREAYEQALCARSTNSVLNVLFQQAITTGKRARSQTDISLHAVSTGYAAVELAKQLWGQLSGRTVMILGAGEIGELTVKHLVACGASSVIVSNRSFDRALELASQFGGEARKFDQLIKSLEQADIVISCTAADHYVVHGRQVEAAMQARQGKPILFIDIAVPRDIEPVVANVSGVHLYDIDDLSMVVNANLQERRLESAKAEAIVQEEYQKFGSWLNERTIIPTVAALKGKADLIKQEEIRRALNRLGKVSEREEKIVVSMANSIVNRLLHDPILGLKAGAQSYKGHLYAQILQSLFKLYVNETGETCVEEAVTIEQAPNRE